MRSIFVFMHRRSLLVLPGPTCDEAERFLAAAVSADDEARLTKPFPWGVEGRILVNLQIPSYD